MTVHIPKTHEISAGDRTIAWCELGAPEGTPVLAAHGSPGSRFQLLALHKAALSAGVRLIAPDRPGFGGTSPSRVAGWHTWDADALALLDALELPSVTALGFSGGSGYALALAAAHPERVTRVVSASGMIPGAPASAVEGRIPIVSLLYRVSRRAPWLATAMLEGKGPFKNTREANFAAWPEADQKVMSAPSTKHIMAPDAEAGAAQGARAGINDLARYYTPLPEGLEAVRQPVTLIHGTADGNVPIGVPCWAAKHLPNARLVEVPEAGHYFAVTSPELIIGELV